MAGKPDARETERPDSYDQRGHQGTVEEAQGREKDPVDEILKRVDKGQDKPDSLAGASRLFRRY